jgi:F0F1-type ATP synthase assembly protein I
MPSDQMMLQVFFMGMILGGVVGFVAGSVARKTNDTKAVERVERTEEEDDPADWWKRT